MSQSVATKAFGAVNALEQVGKAVVDGEISAAEEASIIEGARLQNGKLDPEAVTRLENVAKQLQTLSRTLRTKIDAEAVATIDLASFPISQAKLEELGKAFLPKGTGSIGGFFDLGDSLSKRVLWAVSRTMPMSMSTTTTVRGGVENAGGGYDVLVAIHGFASLPKNDSEHYVVSIERSGQAGQPQRVRVA